MSRMTWQIYANGARCFECGVELYDDCFVDEEGRRYCGHCAINNCDPSDHPYKCRVCLVALPADNTDNICDACLACMRQDSGGSDADTASEIGETPPTG